MGNDQTWLTIPKNSSTGDFELEHELNQYAGSGTYSVRSIRITDDTGLTIKLNESQLIGLGFSVSSTLSNPQSDDDDPYVVNFSASGWNINNDIPEIIFELQWQISNQQKKEFRLQNAIDFKIRLIDLQLEH